jgi:hypothetical protein
MLETTRIGRARPVVGELVRQRQRAKPEATTMNWLSS